MLERLYLGWNHDVLYRLGQELFLHLLVLNLHGFSVGKFVLPMEWLRSYFNSFYSPKMFDGTEGPKTAPMTIFYAGQVFVFNDFPADRAKEVMLLASKGSKSQMVTHQPTLAPKIQNQNSQIKSIQRVPQVPVASSNPIQDCLHRPVEPIASGN